MRSREARFIGHGNFAQGEGHCRINAWRLTCSQCRDIKVIAMPHGDLPPNLLIKKFHQAGWIVGKKTTGDLCGACQKKQKQGQVVAMPAPAPAPTIAAPPPARPTTEPPPDDGVITITVLRYKELTAAWRLRRAGIEPLKDEVLINIHAMLCAGQIDDARRAIEAYLPDAKAIAKVTAKAPRISPAEIIQRDDTFDEWLNNLEKNHRAKGGAAQ